MVKKRKSSKRERNLKKASPQRNEKQQSDITTDKSAKDAAALDRAKAAQTRLRRINAIRRIAGEPSGLPISTVSKAKTENGQAKNSPIAQRSDNATRGVNSTISPKPSRRLARQEFSDENIPIGENKRCKPRPNNPKGKGKGGSKRFVPWC